MQSKTNDLGAVADFIRELQAYEAYSFSTEELYHWR